MGLKWVISSPMLLRRAAAVADCRSDSSLYGCRISEGGERFGADGLGREFLWRNDDVDDSVVIEEAGGGFLLLLNLIGAIRK